MPVPQIDPQIHESWKGPLHETFNTASFHSLVDYIKKEKKSGQCIYPPGSRIFEAFNTTPLEKVRVVMLGQDPYHGPGQANGLCFSVYSGVEIPPSLVNIFKEIRDDLGHPLPSHGDLKKWANQGVLLLNAMLTVRAHQAGSHQGKGWEQFTDAVIMKVSECRNQVVFLLWGRFAQSKEVLIDTTRHFVLKAPHPSPLSASRGFFGCRHFSRTNDLLKQSDQDPIDWQIV